MLYPIELGVRAATDSSVRQVSRKAADVFLERVESGLVRGFAAIVLPLGCIGLAVPDDVQQGLTHSIDGLVSHRHLAAGPVFVQEYFDAHVRLTLEFRSHRLRQAGRRPATRVVPTHSQHRHLKVHLLQPIDAQVDFVSRRRVVQQPHIRSPNLSVTSDLKSANR